MKSSISKSNRSKNLKNTHTIPDIEKLMEEKLGIILNGSTLKDKKEAKRQLRLLERHFNDINSKNENGHKYPEHRIYHSDNKRMNKEDIYKLIDSVPDVENKFHEVWEYRDIYHCPVLSNDE
jgi:hypothetical protein